MAGLDMFKKGKKPAFQDDGPPAMGENESRGAGGSSSDSGDDGGDSEVYASDMNDAAGDDGSSNPNDNSDGDVGKDNGYGDIEAQAADDLADFAGVSPEDRMDFAAALKTYVSACVSKLTAEDKQNDMASGMPAGDQIEEG
jgi:hypothetical protein